MKKQILKQSLLKAIIITILFTIIHQLYSLEIIRKNIEDVGFDLTNKFIIKTKEQKTNSPKVLLFGFDDLYMKSKNLLNEQNNTNYGYIFPRSYIADFIKDIDELCTEVESKNIPKALFIDYDFSFTSLPYGKKLSYEDKYLLEVLKKKRPYTILLAKNDTYNFIEKSEDKDIQELISSKKIIFVSVKILKSVDGVARRYLTYKDYQNKIYPNVNVALWNLSHKNKLDITQIKNEFKLKDIVSNRIFLKDYKSYIKEDMCRVDYSYWTNYTKYSASCSLYEIDEDDFSNAIILLGGTYSKNTDTFEILESDINQTLKGIELQSNILMSIFYLDGQLQQINIWYSILIVFSIYFLIDFIISFIFKYFNLINEKLLLFFIFMILTLSIMLISYYLLSYYHIWFNWFVPIVLFEIYDIILYINMKRKGKQK